MEVVSPMAAVPGMCGVLWFVHIGKAGGGTIQSMMHTHAKELGWKFLNLHSADPHCQNDVLLQPNLSHWEHFSKVASVQGFFEELRQPRPMALVHQHGCPPGLGSPLLDDLLRLNASLAQRGCEVVLTTLLREPVELTKSRLAWGHIKVDKQRKWVLDYAKNQQLNGILFGESAASPQRHPHLPQLLDNKTQLLRTQTFANCSQALLMAEYALSHFRLVGRTANLTAFAWELFALMRGGRDHRTAGSKWLPDDKVQSTAPYQHFSNTSLDMIEHVLRSEVPSLDECIYSHFSSSTGLMGASEMGFSRRTHAFRQCCTQRRAQTTGSAGMNS